MRIGLAGVGRIGSLHARTLCDLPRAPELLVADPVAERAAALASERDAIAAVPAGELLAAGLDALVVASATDTHAALVTAAVAAGIPVFCEKPLAADLAATRAVVDAVDAAGAVVQVGFQRRFDAGYRALRDAVADGRLGWTHTLRSTTFDPAPPPAGYLPGSGGLFRDCGVHDFDAVRFVTGREVVEVYATGANRGDGFFAAAGDVDTASALLTLDDGTLGTVSCTRYNGAGYDVRLEVFGSAGSLAAGLDERTPLASAEPHPGLPAGGKPYANFLERFHDAYAAELRAFVEVAAGGADNPCPPADALAAFRIAEACELSRAEGRPVLLDEVTA
jgi:myo-inositol 2-dehydrogenase/D-chiro-inositol 1-dehydrogenase